MSQLRAGYRALVLAHGHSLCSIVVSLEAG
jgi:hypothetical protein